MADFSNLLGGGGGGAAQPKASSTAATIFGGYNSSQQLETLAPWLIGGLVVIAIAFAAVLIAAIKR
jgi:hypothetical protein